MEESSNSSCRNYCYNNTRISVTNDGGLIRKGPWKPEEDQVLLDHVNKYGPRDWSSIRSKGLLQRTGKSCRLRWVNKLRPDLKIGCKFTAEEERVVIELQSQLGNKWATIATHLVGRTDNDVKNFWSSRQKRLSRIFQSQSPKLHKRHKSSTSSINGHNASSSNNPSLSIEVPKTCYSQGKTSSKAQSSPSSHTGTTTNTIHMIAVPDTSNPECPTSEANNNINLRPIPLNEHLISNELQLDSSFLETFGYTDEPVLSDEGLQPLPCFGAEMWDPTRAKGAIDDYPVTLDSFFDDFPTDMFDQIEPLPSPSSW